MCYKTPPCFCAWRQDVSFICLTCLAPVFLSAIGTMNVRVAMGPDHPELRVAEHAPFSVPLSLEDVDLTSTSVNSLMTFHDVPAGDIWGS